MDKSHRHHVEQKKSEKIEYITFKKQMVTEVKIVATTLPKGMEGRECLLRRGTERLQSSRNTISIDLGGMYTGVKM